MGPDIPLDSQRTGPLGFLVRARLEGLDGEIAAGALHQNFHAPFGLLELFLAIARKDHTFLEKFHGFVKRKICVFEFADDFFQTRQRPFKFRFLRGRLDLLIRNWIQLILPLAARTEKARSSTLLNSPDAAASAATAASLAFASVHLKDRRQI